ncbi:acetoacetate metabolism regulatory protein AtoC [Capsulimonas corticalis]|uniref:Acetoacetate metabolism regulatory protein AtoC n=1 Tax=Capsulimonas corticalis TaxID=2219043 RepID=A0A402CXK4_9BACT|nr:sigma-54 dependent transcriptional regulator [Capsulimonas corticalis]BDI32248.1 acetoacetate metabolism regulatory protein AtoC [Capsulimonas corticalis]
METASKDGTSAQPRNLLIADDEQNIRRVLEAIFKKDGYQVFTAENGLKALEIASSNTIDVLVTDLIMPDMNGVELLQKVKVKHPNSVAIMITAYATIKTCVDAMRYGAADYITKPFDVGEVRAIVKRCVERSTEHRESGAATAAGTKKRPASAVSEPASPAMKQIQQMISRVAASRATVLIRGESGTGKELVARSLHQQSDRASGPFVAISCAALSETLLESELFGHDKNAFTGALAEKKGRFEMAHGGTLFLDEIGDISPSVQIKLLRVLQQREFERVGGTKTIKVDVRLIAATNADLEQLIKHGKFREDLYYRLDVIQIVLPPLRERAEDIPILVDVFLDKFNRENGRNISSVSPEAMLALSVYSWPGNVRELENVIERCTVMSDPDATVLLPSMLPTMIRERSLL